jgi:UDP-N-acetylglucosamine enolpyruvyl transferase
VPVAQHVLLALRVADTQTMLTLPRCHFRYQRHPTREDLQQITIEGVERLHRASWRIMPDRIEAGTFLAAAAATCGDIVVRGANPSHLTAVLDKLRATGKFTQVKALQFAMA